MQILMNVSNTTDFSGLVTGCECRRKNQIKVYAFMIDHEYDGCTLWKWTGRPQTFGATEKVSPKTDEDGALQYAWGAWRYAVVINVQDWFNAYKIVGVFKQR